MSVPATTPTTSTQAPTAAPASPASAPATTTGDQPAAVAGGSSSTAPATPPTDTKATPPAPFLDGLKAEQEQKPEGEASKEGDGTTPPASDELEIKLPEGFDLQGEALDGFKALAKEAGLTSEAASKLVALHAQAFTAHAEAQAKAWEQQGQAWKQELQADKSFDVQAAQKGALRFDPEGKAQAALRELGLEYHPALVRVFERVGKAIAEDTSGSGGGAPTAQPTEQDNIRAIYPNSPQMWGG